MSNLQKELEILEAHIDNLITEIEILDLKVKQLKNTIDPSYNIQEGLRKIYEEARQK